jgi:putative FmdB family regulatory protein
MPTYDYKCTACKHTFEHFQSMKDAVLRTCPACKKKTLERLIGTGAALIFKGAGFYQTDYRSESYKAREKADAAPSADTAASSDAKKDQSGAESATKSEAKPGTKSETKQSAPSSGGSDGETKHTRTSVARGTTSKVAAKAKPTSKAKPSTKRSTK